MYGLASAYVHVHLTRWKVLETCGQALMDTHCGGRDRLIDIAIVVFCRSVNANAFFQGPGSQAHLYSARGATPADTLRQACT